MSLIEPAEIEPDSRGPLAMRVRLASPRDYDALCGLFDELDEIHRQARPDLFKPSTARPAPASRSSAGWPNPNRPCWWHRARRASSASLCWSPAHPRASPVRSHARSWKSTIWWCGPINAAGGSEGACFRLPSNGRASAGLRMSRFACTISIAMRSASTAVSASPPLSTGWCSRRERRYAFPTSEWRSK